jgi:hypothetical protein
LVLVDGTGIRKKIKKDYDKAVRDLAGVRRQLDQFHQTDLPQFTCWLHTHFGALLTELRELSHKMAADEELIFQVENEVFFGGGSYARAYQRVIEFRENPRPQPPPPADSGESGAERDPFDDPPEAEDLADDADPRNAFFDAVFGESGPGEDPQDNQDPRGGPRAKPAAPVPASSRLKELYRALVRRLHPDTQREMTPQKIEWWHQAQEAYQAGDAEQLEVILTLCEIGDSGTTQQTSASLLQRITARLKSSLRGIKRQVAALRKDPAWGFSARADHEGLAVQLRRAMTGDLQEMRRRWTQTQETIAKWKAAAERLNQVRRRKPRPQNAGPQLNMEFPF